MSDPTLFKPTLPGESVVNIWDGSRILDRTGGRIELTDLVRFKDHWYCGFREAEIHNNHPSGRGRIIRSRDGVQWESVKLLEWDGADVREPKFAVTADGNLMVTSSVYFVSRHPRRAHQASAATSGAEKTYTPPEARKADDRGDRFYTLDYLGTVLNLSDHDREPYVAQQMVSWLTQDGLDWGSAYAAENTANTWLWGITWHNGMGYSLAQWGKDGHGTLYRTRDGKSWRELVRNCGPDGRCNEGSIAFGADDTAYCLFRDGTHQVMIGTSPGPYYQQWTWKPALVDYGPDHGGAKPATEQLGTSLGGPKLIRLSDGRLVGAGRALGPNRNDGRATLFWVDPKRSLLTRFAEFDGTTYPGLAEHEGMLYVTFVSSACHRNQWEVHLGKIRIPQ